MNTVQKNKLSLGLIATVFIAGHGCQATQPAARELLRTIGARHQVAKHESSAHHDQNPSDAFATEESWEVWRRRELTRLALASYQSNASYIYETIQQHSSQLSSIGDRSRCFDNLTRFTRRQWLAKQTDHKFGLDLDDASYIALLKGKGYLNLPEPLGSQGFLDLLDRTGSDQFDTIESNVRAWNPSWRVLYFKSRILTTVDDSQARGRLLVYVPSETTDRFIQFGVRDTIDAPLSESISEIVVEKSKKLSDGSITENTVYYVDLWRVRKQQQTLLSTRLESVKTSEACYSCHQAPLLTIRPLDGSVKSQISQGHLKDINDVIESYGSAKIYSLDEADLGPSVGSLQLPEVTQKALAVCVNSRTGDPDSALRVRQAMQCATCHNGVVQSNLHFQATQAGTLSQASSLLKRAILDDQTMPPSSSLTPSERQVAYDCLLNQITSPQDLSGALEQWLMQSDCTASAAH